VFQKQLYFQLKNVKVTARDYERYIIYNDFIVFKFYLYYDRDHNSDYRLMFM